MHDVERSKAEETEILGRSSANEERYNREFLTIDVLQQRLTTTIFDESKNELSGRALFL